MNPAKRYRFSYQWRLFIPLTATLWVSLFLLAGLQYYREREYRRNFVSNQLELVNESIVDAIDSDDPTTVGTFLGLIDKFYRENDLFDSARITIFDNRWNVVDTVGRAIVLDPNERSMVSRQLIERKAKIKSGASDRRLGNQKFFYMGKQSRGGMTVITALPDDDVLSKYINGDSQKIWIVIFVVALIMTFVFYYSTRFLGKNINILRDFANRTANDPWFTPGTDYPHDELGDIARQIVQIYNERALAREHIEQEHRTAIHAIEEKARQKRQLTNNINHELKTPIGVIKGYLDTIVDTPDMDPAMRDHFIRKARDHANRLVDLVADLAAITRLEEGDHRINTERLDFHELAYTFANDVRESGALGHFDLVCDLPLGMEIRGNTNLLVGMLMNLAKNAVNYSQGTTCTIEYRGEDVDGNYVIAFYDDGIGVPPESLEHLFDRFYRIDSGRARKSGGTGLGLSIVWNTVKAHGGSIIARNRAEGGLEFVFTIPKWRG